MNRLFDRNTLVVKPLAERKNKLDVRRDHIDAASFCPVLDSAAAESVRSAAAEVRAARARRAPVILAFGAHAIKNGLSGVMIRLMRGGWVTHFATNGAGVIHNWEFAYQGRSGEDVRRYVAEGQFGIWEETGAYLNLAFAVGAWRGLGYGESVGALVADDGLLIPGRAELAEAIAAGAGTDAGEAALARAAAAADLAALLARFKAAPGFLRIEHPLRRTACRRRRMRRAFPSRPTRCSDTTSSTRTPCAAAPPSGAPPSVIFSPSSTR